MSQYTTIQSAAFAGTALTSVLLVRIVRRAATNAQSGDADAFATSVQPAPVQLEAELRTRDIAAAEAFAIGTQGTLSFETASAQAGQAGREVTLDGAMLTATELTYEQSAIGIATLRFVVEAADGVVDPFTAQEVQA
jgi:hypothetical protein